MRRMADMQLDELYVATSAIGAVNTGLERSGSTNESSNGFSTTSNKKKKSFVGGLFRGGGSKTKGATSDSQQNLGSGGSVGSARRIRYKPDSNLAGTRSSSGRTRSNNTLNDRQLQEAIELSIYDHRGGGSSASRNGRSTTTRNRSSSNGNRNNAESEEEILWRVLEQSKLEATANLPSAKTRHITSTTGKKHTERNTGMDRQRSRRSSGTSPSASHENNHNNRKPPPQRKHPSALGSASNVSKSNSASPPSRRKSSSGRSNNPSR
mmetsp:Transcript_34118/g.71282  ORF Transcript_34118/g.71282 Transcript_34118/m.71282 type:complete len:266 (-) Transcript_34118:665-1462(-)